MEGIEIRAGKQEEKRENRGFGAELAFFLAGVFGLLLFLHSLDGVHVNSLIIYPFSGFLGGALWYTWNRKKKLFYLLLSAILPVGAWYLFLFRDTLRLQFDSFLSGMAAKTGGETADITQLAILFAALLTVFLFLMECVMEKHGTCILLTSLPLLFLPMLAVREEGGAGMSGVRAARLTCYPLLLLFQIAFQVIRHTGKGRGNRSFAGVGRMRLSLKGCAAAAGLFCAVVLAAAVPVLLQEQAIYEMVYRVEGYLTRTFRNMTGMAQETAADGRVSRGNNYRTGTVQLILQTDRKPTETLYLRGFDGGEYAGGNWMRSSDEALFERMAERLDWGEWSYMIGGMYYSMYYMMNENVYPEDEPLPRPLLITHTSGNYFNAYVPYYSQRGAALSFLDGTEAGYAFRYYEQQDMRIGEGRIPESAERLMEWYRELENAYLKEAQMEYTRVPAELLPRLTALVEENPLENLDEITAFILYTLQSNTSYTLTPGRAPLNEDVVEYFLFEGKRGYCVHYASAATLMYRLYGIPARYASGYAIQPSAFVRASDGSWEAEVTDEQAHAWVEIFLEDYGWTPVEVTPAAGGTEAVSYPGFRTEKLSGLLAEHGWDMSRPSFSENDSEETAEEENGAGTVGEPLSERILGFLQSRRAVWQILVACMVYTLLLIPLFLDYRRLRIRKRMETAGCRRVFDRLIQMLHFCGCLTEDDGTREDFPEKLAAACSLSTENAERLREIVERAAYGAGRPEEEEEEFVRKMYLHAAGTLYQKLRWEKKLVFRYLKAFD